MDDPVEADLSWARKWLLELYQLEWAEGHLAGGLATAHSLSATTERAAAALNFGEEPSGYLAYFQTFTKNPSMDT